jgi:hypothetical protein
MTAKFAAEMANDRPAVRSFSKSGGSLSGFQTGFAANCCSKSGWSRDSFFGGDFGFQKVLMTFQFNACFGCELVRISFLASHCHDYFGVALSGTGAWRWYSAQ